MIVEVRALAESLRDALAPACARLEIAGSIRRGKPDPSDIELVAIPYVTDLLQELDLFGGVVDEIYRDHLGEALDALFAGGAWGLDTQLPRNGPKYKRLRHAPSGVCCDLFITTAESWGVIFTIRTGPSEFSTELVTRARRRGLQVQDGRVWRLHRDGTRTALSTPEEADFFHALGLPYMGPGRRTLEALRAVESQP